MCLEAGLNIRVMHVQDHCGMFWWLGRKPKLFAHHTPHATMFLNGCVIRNDKAQCTTGQRSIIASHDATFISDIIPTLPSELACA